MPICLSCQLDKPVTGFQLRDGRRRSNCRACRRAGRRVPTPPRGCQPKPPPPPPPILIGKICYYCQIDKPLTDFSKAVGRRSQICKECTTTRRIEKRKTQCSCGKLLEPGYRLCAVCLVKKRAAAAKQRQKRRLATITHYGGECVYCGISELIFLTIDHVDGNGKEHRKTEGNHICAVLRRHKAATGQYPTGFQVLCWNCNSAKHIHGEEAVRAAVARMRLTLPAFPASAISKHEPACPNAVCGID